ncbi:hypothetical protein BH23DEI1_BH23DEI1_20330 [soil metagenome]
MASDGARRLLERITSVAPTRYLVRTDTGDERYVFCAYDALLVAHLLLEPVRLQASPPRGAAFDFVIAPDSAGGEVRWLTFVESAAALPAIPGMPSPRCPFMHLFVTSDDAWWWRDELPERIAGLVSILTYAEAWRRARDQVVATL